MTSRENDLLKYIGVCKQFLFSGWQMPYMGQNYQQQQQGQDMQLQGLGFQPASITQRSDIPHAMPGTCHTTQSSETCA